MFIDILIILLSYLLGSISFSIVIVRWVKGIDIREHGSGNAGATNTMRVLGKGPGICVFLLDIAKGIVAVLLSYWINSDDWVCVACGLAAIAGHNWPIWFRFKGGKGIATMVGVVATLAFIPALYAGVIAIIIIAITRFVSLGSLIFAALTPVFVLLLSDSMPLLYGVIILAIFAFVRHRSNIVRLMQGTENKLGVRKGM